MSREMLLQASFNAGVMSPRLLGRSDFQKYSSAAALLSNIIPLASGPAMFRPGTLYISSVLDSTIASRLIPFSRSADDTYMVEFTNQKIRFFRNRAAVLSTAAISNGTFTTDLTGWTTSVTGTGAVSQSAGKASISAGAAGTAELRQAMTYLGVAQYTITGDVTVGNLTVNIGTTAGASDIATGTLSVGTGSTFSFTPAAAHATWFITFRRTAVGVCTLDNVVLSTPEYIIDSPYTTTVLPGIHYTQDADVMYLALESMTIKTYSLQRYGHDKWQLVVVTYNDGPYLTANQDPTKTLDISSGVIGAGLTLVANFNAFVSTDVGRNIRLNVTGNEWGWCTVTAYTSATQVTVTLHTTLSSAVATNGWRFGAFSDTTGYPGVITFHEGRMVVGKTPVNSNWIWMSESQGFGLEQTYWAPTTAAGTVTDAHSTYFPLSAGDVSDIMWMSSGSKLAVGTQDGEWIIEGSDTSKAISPTNGRPTRQTQHGSLENVNPVRIDGALFFAKVIGSKVVRFSFTFSKDQFESVNISLLSEHLFVGKTIVDMVYAAEPASLVWVLFDDGTLASLTFVDSEDVGGWAYHGIADQWLAGGMPLGVPGVNYSDLAADVENIAVLKTTDYSEIWMVVKRTINGATTRYLEVMEQPFFMNNLGKREDAINVDSAKKYDGADTTTITGLNHLEGRKVCVFANGIEQTSKTVSSGQITLDSSASVVTVGLPYYGDVENLDFDAQNAFGGSSLGQIRRITEPQLRLFESGPVYVARVGQGDSALNVLSHTEPYLLDGIHEVDIDTDWDLSSRMRIQFRSPYPGTLCAIMFKAQVNEG